MQNNKLYCTLGDHYATPNKFWTSESVVNKNGYMHICTDCINKLFTQLYKEYKKLDEDFILDGYSIEFDSITERILKETCRYVDLSFNYDAYNALQSHILTQKNSNRKVSNIIGIYKSKLFSVTKNNSGIGTTYKHSDNLKQSDEENKNIIGINQDNLIHLQDKYGYGYKDYEYLAFERKYKKIIKGYKEKTSLHTERLLTYIIHKVKGELAATEGNVSEAEKWEKLAQSDATAAKLNVSQLSKSDITGGIDLIPQLVEAVEERASLIGIMPKLKAQPYDDADVILWGVINKLRRNEDKPPISYKEIWDFYDEMLRETFKQKRLTDEEIEREINKRIKPFKDLGEIYKEPLYDSSDSDFEEGDDDIII